MPFNKRDSHVTRQSDLVRKSPEAIPRDDLRGAYEGKGNTTHKKGERLSEKSDRTPVR